jgi:glycosyltransferase involved in cell wall biosynthesis
VPDALFVLAGIGELMPSLKELAASLGLQDHAIFVGRCSRVPELLAASNVGVLSSSAEGFSNAILEYMASSLPVVATDVGGAREVIREGVTGHLVPARDFESMGARIIDLLKNPERARAMGEEGRAYVAEQLTLENRLARTEDLYDRLLERTKGKA